GPALDRTALGRPTVALAVRYSLRSPREYHRSTRESCIAGGREAESRRLSRSTRPAGTESLVRSGPMLAVIAAGYYADEKGGPDPPSSIMDLRIAAHPSPRSRVLPSPATGRASPRPQGP